ncbi:MAG TPA: hypothetical protein VFC43_02250 [Methanoregula sp.]|nr:hypothetical protein [Methanoregula sp.]
MISIVRGFAYLSGHLPFIPYSVTLERYPARTYFVFTAELKALLSHEASISAPAF